MKKIAILGLVSAMAILSGCESLTGKAVGISNSTSGFYLQTTASAQTTSLPSPTIWIARNQISLATAPAVEAGKQTQPVFTMSTSRSFFGSLFGIDDSSYTMSYIGTPGETASDTAKRLEALNKIKNHATVLTESDSTDSGTMGE